LPVLDEDDKALVLAHKGVQELNIGLSVELIRGFHIVEISIEKPNDSEDFHPLSFAGSLDFGLLAPGRPRS
jgi:hypothetical protein